MEKAASTGPGGPHMDDSVRMFVETTDKEDLANTQMAEKSKSESTVDVKSLDSPSGHSGYGDASAPNVETWKPSFLRMRPLAGLTAIGIIVSCMFANLGILLASNHAPIDSWRYQPSTYLAIMTAISNLALRYASFQGLVIAWWYRASVGTTIKKLQQDWQTGTHFFSAIAAGRHIGFIGLACVFATLGAIDGPLLQRATTVVSRPYVDLPVPMTTSLVSELPTGLSGLWGISSDGEVTTAYNKKVPTSLGNVSNNVISMDSVYFDMNLRLDYMNDAAIMGGVVGCDGTCRFKVLAPALAVDACTSYHQSVNYTTPSPLLNGPALSFERVGFLTSMNLLIDEELDRERINVVSGYSQTTNCAGILNYTACTLDSAIGEYSATISDGRISLDPLGPTIVAIANNTAVNHTQIFTGGVNGVMAHNSTLAGIVDLALAKWLSEAAFPDGGTKIVENLPAQQYQIPNYSACTQWSDPLPDILQDLNTLMFRAGIYVGAAYDSLPIQKQQYAKPGLNTTVTGHQIGSHNVFSTNIYFFLAAALLEALCIFLVLPTYWGWWRLGRNVSLSPLEIAKAFDAPLLQSCHASSAREIAATIGAKHVQYGSVDGMRRRSFF